MNYFDILDFQSVGHGVLQDREGARTNPNHVPRPLCTPKPPRVYPPMGIVIDDTLEALFNLADTLLQHGIVFQGNVGQGVGTSKAGPLHTQDPLTRSPTRTRHIDHTGEEEGLDSCVIPNPCTACGGIFYGPTS